MATGVLAGAAARAVDDVGSLAVAWPRRPVLDRVGPVVSAGNGVPVWAAIAVALGLGGPSGRRAAGAGALGAACASVASNQVLKRSVHRPRPVRFPRRGTPKSSGSLPSSHLATGFGFATSAAVVWPTSAAVTLPVALTIGASRVYDRRHRLSEVVAGAALGGALGLVVGVGVRRWSNRDHAEAGGRDEPSAPKGPATDDRAAPAPAVQAS